MDDLQQGIAFSSAVNVDKCLRKEVDMECVAPSHPVCQFRPGSLSISRVCWKRREEVWGRNTELSASVVHRAETAVFLKARAARDFGEVKGLAQKVHGVKFEGGIGDGRGAKGKKGKRGEKGG